MDKTFIEKRINDKVDERIEADYKKVYEVLVDTGLHHLSVKLENGKTYKLFDVFSNQMKITEFIGYDEHINNKREEYERQETDSILRKLDVIEYLFNQQ